MRSGYVQRATYSTQDKENVEVSLKLKWLGLFPRFHVSSFQVDHTGVPLDEPRFLDCFEQFFSKAAASKQALTDKKKNPFRLNAFHRD